MPARGRMGSRRWRRLPWTVASSQRPIGVFDSGVGGLAILTEIRRLLPDETVVYVADRAWAPYGRRSLEEVRERAVAITGMLLGRGAKAVVVACNSASAAALHHLRGLHPEVPFVGMEPAVKPAAARANGGAVGVLATAATFQGELYASVVDRHAGGARIVEAAPAGLVEAIEGGDDARVDAILRDEIGALLGEGATSIVLGCTHFSFVADRITRLAGPEVPVVDPSTAVARQVRRVVTPNRGGSGTTVYLTTADPDGFASRLAELTGVVAEVGHLSV